MPAKAHDPLLEIRGLKTWFHTDEGVSRAVDGVSCRVGRSETLCVVGESGCGKTVTAMSVLRLIPTPPGKIVAGEINFQGRNLLTLPGGEMRAIRGNKISMIFQEPMSSLNPVFRVGEQIAEALTQHQRLKHRDVRDRTVEMLRKVGIPSPESRIDEYPHQMSGGMKQRVMIAMALACNPLLLIADEPTTALDVTIQAQILDLLRELQEQVHMAILLITHDLGVVAEMADNVAVFYAGRVVEYAPVHELFLNPRHPYTVGLFHSLPRMAPRELAGSAAGVPSRPGTMKRRLNVIPGTVPNPIAFPPGCRFAPRCAFAIDRCRREDPPAVEVGEGHTAACLRLDQIPREHPLDSVRA